MLVGTCHRLGRVLVFAVAMMGLYVAPSLAQADAAADYRAAVLADNPVSYWRLNDTSGSTAVDEENHNSGQISGATLGEPGPFAGSGSMRFEGNGDVNLGTDPSLRPPSNWTVEAWFRASASDTANCVNTYHGNGCEFYAVHAFGLHFGLDPQGHVFGAFDSTSTQGYGVESAGTYGDDTWHQIVLVRATSQLTLYIDGSEVATTAVAEPTTFYCCEDIATIANDDACRCAPLTGWESEVAFYNYALPVTRIAAHWTAANITRSAGGGGSSGALSCAATSSAATLANLSAEICRLINDESTIVAQQGVLLGVVGTFPRVSPTGVNMYTGTPIATVPGSEAASTQAAMHLMEEALQDFSQEVADAVVDKIADAYPDTVQAIHDLGSAEEEDLNAATEQLKAAKAIVDSLGGLTAISLTEIAYHTASATLHLLKKLEAFQKALEKFKVELVNNSQAPTQEQIELEGILAQYIKALSGDTTAVTSAMSQIAMVPQGGYDVYPGLPVNEFYPGSGATVVVDPGDFSNGVLASSSNPFGISPGAVVNLPTVPSPIISSGSVNTEGTLVVSGNAFGVSTSVETALGSGTSVGSAIGALPSVASGSSSLRALLASVPAVPATSSAPTRLAIVKADVKGRFSTRVQIPANAAPGKHELYVIGMAPNGSPRLLETSITVSAPPILTNLTQSRRRWREGSKLARTSRRSRRPIGTVFSFTVNEPAKLSFTFTQPSRGRRVKGRCVAQSRHNRRKSPCKRATTRGMLSFTGHAGLNRLYFQGGISHQEKLKPGSYTLMLIAAGANGISTPRRLSFTVLK